MKNLTPNEKILADDILRYKKNKLASTLALLGLVFNCLYFLLLYAMPRDEFTTISIGFSIILTLAMLLTLFLSSEGVKGYNKKFSIVLLVCAAFQILRIFYYPLKGLTGNWFTAADTNHLIGYFGWFPAYGSASSTPFFIILLVYLIASAACLIGSAVWGYIVAVRLEKFQKAIDNGEVSVMQTIAEMDKQDAAQVAAEPVEAEKEATSEVE